MPWRLFTYLHHNKMDVYGSAILVFSNLVFRLSNGFDNILIYILSIFSHCEIQNKLLLNRNTLLCPEKERLQSDLDYVLSLSEGLAE